MTTPDFEDWLARQEVPIYATTTLDRYIDYLEDEFGIHGGSLDVARGVYEEVYVGLAELGIRPVERHYTYRGETFTEVRYAIRGAPGLWGRLSAYEIAIERAEEEGLYETAEMLRRTYEAMKQQPERVIIRWRGE